MIFGQVSDMLAGKQSVRMQQLDTMPLYVRSGSIVPIGPDVLYADEQPNATLELRIYPGQNGSLRCMRMKAITTTTSRACLRKFLFTGTTSCVS